MGRSKLNKKQLKKDVIEFFKKHRQESFTLKQVFSAIGLTSHPVKILCVDVLNDLLDEGEIMRNYEGEIAYNTKGSEILIGKIVPNNSHRMVFESENGEIISIKGSELKAMVGDTVKLMVLPQKQKSDKRFGEVTEVIERSGRKLIGVLQLGRGIAFVVSSDPSVNNDIYIPEERLNGAKNGDKVAVRVIDWPKNARNPIGEIVDLFGKTGENDAEMHAILTEFGLPYSYPEEVEKYADKISDEISKDEIARREDFRKTTTFTIDPKDAKDFDDALSIRPLENGHYEVGVHIADVSHYVLEGSVIDKEAQERATSVYLVDRTIPMLPERLCNYICSLRPDEEKLAYSVIFDMDEEAHVYASRIVHTVIKSNRRFTYEEVQAILEKNGEADDIPDRVPVAADKREGEYCDELITLNRMAHQLKKNRMTAGAIDFDREEVRFEIDSNGKPVSVYFKVAKDANKLVEEFMLLANRTVAESVGKVEKGKKAKTLPYRVHDLPDPGKLDNLAQFVGHFNFKVVTDGSKTEVAKSINKLLKDVKGNKIQNLVETVSLRAMMKAKYSTHNIGHYGLAFDYYTHFTSPIRRYPDLMVHRLLTRYSEGGISASQKKYEGLCEHSSAMEQLASSAERASIKYKQVEFMSDKLGEEFDAKISGVTESGIFAEIKENHCEGFIQLRFLDEHEDFDFDEKNYCLIGRKTKHRFSMGDDIRIKVAKANLFRRTLDFDFVKKN